MHHAPAGPRLLARVAGLLAPLVYLLRRTRVLSVALAAIALGAFALAAPLAPYDDARGTAALTAGADDGLVPATGDGWTRDGVPAPSSDDEQPSSSSSSSSRTASTADSSSSAAGRATYGPASAHTSSAHTSSAGTSSVGTSSAGTSTTSESPAGTSSSSPRPPSAGADRSPEPVETSAGAPVGTPPAETPVIDPADQVLALVNSARETAGCAALGGDAALASLAAEHSAAMRDGGFVGVRSPGGGAPLDGGARTAVVATGADPAVVGAAWATEPALLDCGLAAAGVGTIDGYWTLVAA